MKKLFLLFVIILSGLLVNAQEAASESSAEELAKKLANPIASLISVPFQNNMDFGIGPNNGARNTLNIQPVIPIELNENINLIFRWVQPVIFQYNVSGITNSQSGLGDAVVSAFFSPKTTKSGWIWGVGPVLLIPDGTEEMFTTKKLGAGPTAVFLKQSKGITYGALVNQIWSIAGDKERSDVSQFFFQPFVTYNWKTGAGLGANFEMTQNWVAETTNLWLNPVVSGITSLGKQKVQLVIGPRFNLAAPSAAKADWGFRAVVVFLFPK